MTKAGVLRGLQHPRPRQQCGWRMARPRCCTAPTPTRRSSSEAFESSKWPILMPPTRGRPSVRLRFMASSRNFVDMNGDMGWAHSGNDDAEFSAFVANNASGGGELLFGRITYELMASYWPTPNAIK